MLDLGNNVWPYHFGITLREKKGYISGLFGKCMNGDCGDNKQASIGGVQKNLHRRGAFDRWFEGTPYQDGSFYDNEAPGCEWPWPENGQCSTKTNASTVGAGYLTSELGNRTIAWLKSLDEEAQANPNATRRPFFVYFATHAPHGPATPANWYKDACPGVGSPRLPNFNFG